MSFYPPSRGGYRPSFSSRGYPPPHFGAPPMMPPRPSFMRGGPLPPQGRFRPPPYPGLSAFHNFVGNGPPTHFLRPPRYRPPPGAFDPPDSHYNNAGDLPEIDQLPGEDDEDQSTSTNPIPYFSSRPQPFDPYMCDKEFWPQPLNDEVFSKTLIQRNQQITPNDNEQAAVTSLMTRVKSALENIAASNMIPSVKIDEFREIGSYKKGTMLTRRITADLVVFFTTLPTPETVKQLGDGIVQMLKQGATHPNEVFGVVPREHGCDIAGTHAVLKILVAIPADEFHKLDPGLHIKVESLDKNLAALRHALWFDEHAGQPAIKILVRLVKDVKQRCTGLAPLDVWTIELLSHYCVTCTPDKNSLSLTHAFRRFFQLLSSGFLLHTSVGVADPCDQTRRINFGFSPGEADLICRTAQFICRLLMHSQFDRLLTVKVLKNIGTENEAMPNLNIAPLKEAYSKDLIVNPPLEEHFYSRLVQA